MNSIINRAEYEIKEIELVDVWKWVNAVERGVFKDVDGHVSVTQYGSFNRWNELYEIICKFEDILNGISQESDDRISDLLASSEKVIKYFHHMMNAVGVTQGSEGVIFGYVMELSEEEMAWCSDAGINHIDRNVLYAYHLYQLSDDLIDLEGLEMMVRVKGYK